MTELTQHEKEYFAMKGALIAIASARPGTPSSDLQLIAAKVLGYTRRCSVCGKPLTGIEDPDPCSAECREAYRAWQASPAFEPKGGG